MNVSRKSWHYRLYRYIQNITQGPAYVLPFGKRHRRDPDLPGSLCPYAWSILLGLIAALFIAAFLGAGLVLILPFWLIYRAARIVSRALPRRRKRRGPAAPEHPKPDRRPSLLASYVRAKKSKVCPPVNLVD